MRIESAIDLTQQRKNWTYRINQAIPRWGAWVEHLSNSLKGFDQWRPTVPEYLQRASANLEAELERYLEMAINHLHDLWCIQEWLNFPEQVFTNHENLLMNLLVDAMARCGRILSLENIDFLPRPTEVPTVEDWLNYLSISEFGRKLLQSVTEEQEVNDVVSEFTELPALPREAVFASTVRALENAQSTYQLHLEQRQLITRLRAVMQQSPFKGMPLAHSQVATSLNECEAKHVVLG